MLKKHNVSQNKNNNYSFGKFANTNNKVVINSVINNNVNNNNRDSKQYFKKVTPKIIPLNNNKIK